jgi:hypothetical protein
MTIVPVPGDANDNDPIKKLLDWIVNVGINGFFVLLYFWHYWGTQL